MKQETIQKRDIQPQQQTINRTGIPTQMKLDFERRSGLSFDDVRVHYNSDQPAKIGALAYTQGNQVHIGPGQEQHLRHELGHVVQQKRGLVQPTTWAGGLPINDSARLEEDADRGILSRQSGGFHKPVIQRQLDYSNSRFHMSRWPIFKFSDDNQPRFGSPRIPSMTSSFAQVFLTTTRPDTTDAADLYDMDGWRNYLTQNGESTNLLEDLSVYRTLTRMHLINGHFFGPSDEKNMVLGPQGSNRLHYDLVEHPISDFLNQPRAEGEQLFVNYMVIPHYGWFPNSISPHLQSVRDYDASYYKMWIRSCCPKHLTCIVTFYVQESDGQLFATFPQREIIRMN